MALRPLLIALAFALVAAPPSLAAAAPDGQALFISNCSACHQATGLGVPGAFPALAGDKFVTGDGKTVAHVVLFGRGGMPAFKGDLGDADIAAILTYVRSAWGNKAGPVAPQDVAAERDGPQPADHARRLGLGVAIGRDRARRRLRVSHGRGHAADVKGVVAGGHGHAGGDRRGRRPQPDDLGAGRRGDARGQDGGERQDGEVLHREVPLSVISAPAGCGPGAGRRPVRPRRPRA